MRIEYHPAIENELREIVNYYNERSSRLGDEFLNEFERHILKIIGQPRRYGLINGDIRRALMNRFPYFVYFRVLENEVLRVTLIKHQRRHPAYGLTRK